jgi:hypothetical protein
MTRQCGISILNDRRVESVKKKYACANGLPEDGHMMYEKRTKHK